MIEQRKIARVLSRLEYGVYVISMGKDDEGNAFTASWITQVASVPPMVVVSIHNKHQSARMLKENCCFVINILSREAEGIAKTYYGPAESGYDKLKAVPVSTAPVTGCPIIPGAIGFLDCQVVKRVPTGDHTVFFGEVVAAELDSKVEILTSSSSQLRYSG